MGTDRTAGVVQSIPVTMMVAGGCMALVMSSVPSAAQEIEDPWRLASPLPTPQTPPKAPADPVTNTGIGAENTPAVRRPTVDRAGPAPPPIRQIPNAPFVGGRPWYATTTQPVTPPFNPYLAPAAAQKPPVLITPSLGITETWTDNAEKTEDDPEQDAYTTLTANVKVDATSRRFDLGLNYTLSADKYALHPDLDALHHQGLMALDSELIDHTLFIDTRASVSEQSVTASRNTQDNRSSSDAKARVIAATISPRLEHRFGSAAMAALSASHSRTFTSAVTTSATSDADEEEAENLNGSTTNSAKLEVRGGEMFTDVLWDYTSTVSHTDQNDGDDLFQQSHQLATEYRVNRNVGLMAVVGYDLTSGQDLSEDIDGPYYSVGMHWTPTPDMDLRLGVGKRYDQINVFGLIDYRVGPRTSLRFSRDTSVGTDATNAIDRLNAVQRDEQGRFVDPFSGLDASPGTQAYNMSNATYRLTTTRLAATHVRARDTFSLDTTLTEREVLGGNTDATTDSAPGTSTTSLTNMVNWSHNLTPKLASSAWLSTNHVIGSSEEDDSDQSYAGGITLSYQMGEGLSATAGYRYSLSISDEADTGIGRSSSERIAENAVFLGFRKSF